MDKIQEIIKELIEILSESALTDHTADCLRDLGYKLEAELSKDTCPDCGGSKRKNIINIAYGCEPKSEPCPTCQNKDTEIRKGACLALGWMHAEACCSLDKGEDIRKQNVPELLERALEELEITKAKEE
jgi:hypothetical protein